MSGAAAVPVPAGHRLAVLVASGFGVGYAPVAAGTFGSLAALLPGAAMLALLPLALPLAALAATLGGVWAVRASGALDDPGWVVIDEVAGMWIALLALPRPSALGLLTAFLLFRLLDIAKPGPVGWADRQPGPMGVIGDDVLAGIGAAALLGAARWVWPGLFH